MGWSQVIEACLAAGGVVDVASAAGASGLSPRAVRERATREGWWRPYPNVLAPPGQPRDGAAWAKAGVLHARGRTGRDLDPRGEASRDLAVLAAATRDTALAVIGVQRSFPTRAEVVVPVSRRLIAGPRLTVVRSRLIRPQEVGECDGIPVVVGPALLRELSAVRTRSALRAAAIDLAQAGLVDLDEMPTFLASQPRFPGKPLLRQVATDLLGAGRTDSPFEFEVRARLADEGIVLDRGQVPVTGSAGSAGSAVSRAGSWAGREAGRVDGPARMHLDLGILAIRFGIELQSMAYHASRQGLDRDASRANVIAAMEGWRVLYATWSILTDGWDRFVEQVREAITAQSRAHLGVPWPGPEHLR